MAYGDEAHLKGILERNKLERLKRKSPVKVQIADWIDKGGNREVFDKIRNKQFENISKAENYILQNYGSGTRPVMKIISIIDKKEIY